VAGEKKEIRYERGERTGNYAEFARKGTSENDEQSCCGRAQNKKKKGNGFQNIKKKNPFAGKRRSAAYGPIQEKSPKVTHSKRGRSITIQRKFTNQRVKIKGEAGKSEFWGEGVRGSRLRGKVRFISRVKKKKKKLTC